MNEKSEIKEVTKKEKYKFRSTISNQIYIVEVEYYPDKIIVLKFYLKSHSQSEIKFHLLTGNREVRNVVCTCARILLDLLIKDNEFSFGFIGAETIKKDEDKANTKRFRRYCEIVSNYISTDVFEHREQAEVSAYILFNKKYLAEHPEMEANATDLFQRLYLDLHFN